MDESEIVLTLQEYVASLDQSSLPRILQVCSGVYFQGSVYELSGSEVCLSTGDLVKVIGLKLQSAKCIDVVTNDSYELPIDHQGLFTLVAEDKPYNSLEEIIGLLPVSVDALGSFSFRSCSELIVDNFTVAPGQVLTLLSYDQCNVRCQVAGSQGSMAEVHIPLTLPGSFYECQSKHCYSLAEIVFSQRLRSRHFRNARAKTCGGPIMLSPVYQVEAIMHMRKNVVNFPSTLEVDVVDVTEKSQDLEFIKPLTLEEVCAQPCGAFPTVAEILDPPEGSRQFFTGDWHSQFQKGHRLVIHGHGQTKLVLASTPKGRKARQYFLISDNYGGRLRRKAREFSNVYELFEASLRESGLQVSVSRDCEALEEEGLPELSRGDQLEVLRCEGVELPHDGTDGPRATVEALICKRTREEEDEDDADEEDDKEYGKGEEAKSEDDVICLPLYMGGQFLEIIREKRKYSLAEFGKGSVLPLDIKVVSRDTSMEKDPLCGLPTLRLEEASIESSVRASLLEKPEHCFELPVRWLSMSVSFTSEALPWPLGQSPKFYQETVTEVKEAFYYEFRKLTNAEAAPPPRPPKRKVSIGKPKKSAKSSTPPRIKAPPSSATPARDRSLSDSLSQLTMVEKTHRRETPLPPAPQKMTATEVRGNEEEPPALLPRKPDAQKGSLCVPNTYTSIPQKKKKGKKTYSKDNDYEYTETVEQMMKKAQESVMYY